jgi:hypothetical protein
MQEENGLNSEQRDLELALRSLSPMRTQLNPIAAAFEAGRMVHRRQVRVLSAVTTLSLLIAMGSLILTQRPSVSPLHAPIAVLRDSPSMPQFVSSPSAPTLISLEQTLQSRGIDALPTTAVPKVNVNDPL